MFCSTWREFELREAKSAKRKFVRSEATRALSKATRGVTKERRRHQICKTYELKVDKSRLNLKSQEHLRRLFLEAKWFYNDILARGNPWNADYKRVEVLVKNEDGLIEIRKLERLSSQMRQGIVQRVRDNIVSLSKLKKNGHRIGKLKFKSRVNSIPLKQYQSTYWIRGSNQVRIQKLKQSLRVRGLDQIPKDVEVTSAMLIRRWGDYFIHVTTFQPKLDKESPRDRLGIDFGIQNQLTLSNGLSIREGVPSTKRTKRLHRELSRRKFEGKNYQKTRVKLNKEFGWIVNQRKDVRNKIVSRLVSEFETICMQDDFIKGWQTMWGRRVQASGIGGIMSALREKAHTLVLVPRFVATTKTCCRCGAMREMSLKERVYQCRNCGLSIGRDLNSAIYVRNGVPTEHREFTPVDTTATTELMEYLNSIPNVSASLVVEAGGP